MIAIHHAIFIPESKVSASGVNGYGAAVEHTDIQADSIWVDLCRNCRVARDACKAFLEDYVIRSIINVPTLDSAEEEKEKQYVTTALTISTPCLHQRIYQHSYTIILDIASLIDTDSNELTVSPTQQAPSASVPSLSCRFGFVVPEIPPASTPTSVLRSSNKRSRPPSELPTPEKCKWSTEEDNKIINLRGQGNKWDDISKLPPGRSSVSCRLHYPNYLEQPERDEERKNEFARKYERLKSEMWTILAKEMQVAEAMNWKLGKIEMVRRAGVVLSLQYHRSLAVRESLPSRSSSTEPLDNGYGPPPLPTTSAQVTETRRELLVPVPSTGLPSDLGFRHRGTYHLSVNGKRG
ncbi:hypothetical protein QC763_305940 [Podospora pseudopauciseta]|uniref:Myb-like domain-containing protein n=1 Tax=Podospora pseudopauciseta TaxID=2093780 RepID=A0ABR0HGS3_9PEZI|nr:hypothetical protein QC763_305940 [Podospora pseudopauciseta]